MVLNANILIFVIYICCLLIWFMKVNDICWVGLVFFDNSAVLNGKLMVVRYSFKEEVIFEGILTTRRASP